MSVRRGLAASASIYPSTGSLTIAVLGFLLLVLALPAVAGVISGDLTKWHTVTIDFQGPLHQELDTEPNPFLDYRLQVVMTAPSGRTYSVPGFFDGDGNGGHAGSVWRVHFVPDEPGMWSYQASFRAGPAVAVDTDPAAGAPASFDGDAGTFTVQDRDLSAPGFLRHGRLESIGALYLKFRDGGYWVKTGINNPENLLGYEGFDNTPHAWHSYAAHVIHWNAGDPSWDSPSNPGTDDAKGIIGALNYLAAQGINSIYFMPMNIGADGMDTWPYPDPAIDRTGSTANDNRHFDISKLRQWAVVLDHAQRQGLFLHFVLGDKTAANKQELDNATLGLERKLFYRELIARFGHHNALQWNICEEYNLDLPLHPNTIKEFAQYIGDVDPYDHPVTVHPHGNTYKEALAPFMGDDRFGVLSVQTWQLPDDVGMAIEYFREETTAAGRPLPVGVDEHIGMNQISAADYRKRIIWDALFSGGGMELFKSFGDSDLDDFTVYEEYMRYARYARTFVESHLPFWEMSPADHLVSGENTIHGGAEAFVKAGEIYAVFLPSASVAPSLSMGTAAGVFEQRWFNPRTGQFEGAATTFNAAPTISLGAPPSVPQEDWVVLVRAVDEGNAAPATADQGVSTAVNTAVVIPLTYTDPDGPGPYTFTVVVSPQHGTLSPVTPDGAVTYTPGPGFVGTDSFTWQVHDGIDASGTANVTVVVAETVVLFSDDFNRASSLVVGNGWVEREGSGASVEIVSGALQFSQASDLANRPMVYRPVARVSDGGLEWTFVFNWRRTGAEGTYRLFMQLGDGGLMGDTSWDSGIGVNLIWTSIGGAHESLGYRQNGATVALAPVSGSAQIKVSVDFTTRTYAVAVNGAGVGTGIPFDQAVSALDTVRFFTDVLNEAHFAGRRFDDVAVHHAGTGVNRPPVASDLAVATNTAVTIHLQATDADNDPLQYIVVSPPASGSLQSDDGDSAIVYAPNVGFAGVDTFTFKANDGTVDSNVAVVTISVDDGNDPPVVQDQGVNTQVSTAVTIPLAYSDPDGPGPYTFTIVEPPQHGTLSSVDADGMVTYTPQAAFTGTDTFRWQVHDGVETSGTATVSILVTGTGGGSAYGLSVSNSPDRSSPAPLQGAVVTGTIYVFVVPETGVARVRFFLDDPDMTGAPVQVENNPPYDFAGGTVAAASPFDTEAVADGTRTITAAVDRATGGTDVITATFTVANSGPLPAAPPDQIHLAWAEDPATTLTAVWRTRDVTTPSTIEYRPVGATSWQSALGANRASGTSGTLHEVTLRSLTPGTAYEYRLLGDGGLWSPIFVARTAPPPGPADFTAVYVADTGLIGRLDGLATGTEQVVNEIAALEPTLVLPGGDYIYYDTDKRFGTLDDTIDTWFNQMQSIAAFAPLMPTYGNHEALLGEGFGPWAARFPTPAGFDGRKYYSFDVGDVHFVSIFAVDSVGGLPAAALQWIEQDILAAQAAGQQWIIPYLHVSPFADGTNHHSNLQLRAQLGPLFEQLGVKLVLASHDQAYERSYPLVDVPATNTPTSSSTTCYTMSDGVTWVKISPGGKMSNLNQDFSQFATNPPPAWTAVRNNTHHHFARLAVSATGSILLETYGVVGDGSPPVIVDAFAYTTGTCPGELHFDSPAVSMAAAAGGTATAQVNLNATAGTASYTVSAAVPWLTVSPEAGATPGVVTLTADASGLAAGTYTATVTATAPGYTGATLDVTLAVGGGQGAYTIMWSGQANRTAPTALDGAQVGGTIYAFVTPGTGVTRVRFYLDDPGMTGAPRQTENTAPHDFAGGTVATANPFATGQVANGLHTITAAIDRSTGGTDVIHATFTVANP